jgi:hypothetical protein
MDSKKMPNLQLENTWVCAERITTRLNKIWESYVWKRLADLDFCADAHGKITAAKDRFSDDIYYSMKPVLGDGADVKVEQLDARNPLELFISLELHGLLLDGSKT